MTFPRLRARGGGGGRGPQLEDGTFEAVVGPDDASKPSPFTAIAWAPDTFPGMELWCLRTGGGGAPWSQIEPAASGSPSECLFIDQVLTGEFQPPVGVLPDSDATVVALRQYAATRYNATVVGAGDVKDNWEVSIVRPFPQSPGGNQDKKLEAGHVYAVSQFPIGTGQELVTAWVWVPASTNGGAPQGREIWMHYRPGEPGGFSVPGSTPEHSGEQVVSTRLRFEDNTPVHDFHRWKLSQYASTIQRFKTHVLAQGEPAMHSDDLFVLDHRCANLDKGE